LRSPSARPKSSQRRRVALAAGLLVTAVLSIQTAFPSAYGGDYELFISDSVDALVRLNMDDVMRNMPVVGPLSLLLRAPFVAAVFHSDVRVVYFIGCIPLLLGTGLVARWLFYVLLARQRAREVAGAVVLLFLLNPVTFRALHWGHPEELLAAALVVAAGLAALQRRPLLTGLLLGLALATKQWTLLAVPGVTLMLPAHHLRSLLLAAVVVGAFSAPFAIADAGRFVEANLAASNPGRYYSKRIVVSRGDTPRPEGRTPVTPANVWWPFVSKRSERQGGQTYHVGYVRDTVATGAHLAVAVIALLFAAAASGNVRRRPADGFALLALIFLLRSMLDPLDFDYHHAGFLLCLIAWDGLSSRRAPRLSLGVVMALGITFAHHPFTLVQTTAHGTWMNLTYLAWTIPLAAYLSIRVFGRQDASRSYAGSVRNSGSSSARAVAMNRS
jgi:glycosyl transferase family 87